MTEPSSRDPQKSPPARPTEAATHRFVWFRDVPIWLAAVGTVGLLIVAVVTLRPVIENLELRERNRELVVDNRLLETQIESSKQTQRQLDAELQILGRRVEVDGADVARLEKREDKLVDALTRITGNISDQVARERALAARQEQLQEQVAELETTKADLVIEKRRLEAARVASKAKLKAGKAELERRGAELNTALGASRRYILGQITTKIRAATPMLGKRPGNPTFLKAQFSASVFVG